MMPITQGESQEATFFRHNGVTREPAPIVRTLEAYDKGILSGTFTYEFEGKEPSEVVNILFARDEVDNITESLSSGSLESVSRIDAFVLSYSPLLDKISMLKKLLSFEVNSLVQEKVYALIESIKSVFPPETGNLSFLGLIGYVPPSQAAKLLRVFAKEGEKLEFANIYVRHLLREVAAHLGDTNLKEKYLDPRLTERELLGVLEYATKEERSNFFITLIQVSQENPSVKDFLGAKLNNALSFMPVEEKVALGSFVLSHGYTQAEDKNLESLLRSARNTDELRELVVGMGREALLMSLNPEVRELVAKSEIMYLSKGDLSPQQLLEDASVLDIEEGLALFEVYLVDKETSLASLSTFQDTKAYQQSYSDLEYNINYLRTQRDKAQDWAELLGLYRMMREKIEIESRYGVLLTHEEPSPRLVPGDDGFSVILSNGAHWSYEELTEVRAALEKLSDGLLVTTPLLHEIQRVETLGDYILGQRFPDGVIRITDAAVEDQIIGHLFDGTSCLQVTLIHELGHAVQLGNDGGNVEEGVAAELELTPGDVRYDFAEFMKVSGWKIINPSRYTLTNLGLSVMLDDEEVAVGVPVKHKGEEVILVYNQGLLFSYNVHAPFSLIRYSRTNPWEDWAEAFTEYHLMPERLIKFAPEKFKYFEEEFRHYQGREDYRKLLEEQLAKKETENGQAKEQIKNGWMN